MFVFNATLSDGKFVFIPPHVCAGFARANVDQNVAARVRNPFLSSLSNGLFVVISSAKRKSKTEKLNITTLSLHFNFGLVILHNVYACHLAHNTRSLHVDGVGPTWHVFTLHMFPLHLRDAMCSINILPILDNLTSFDILQQDTDRPARTENG